MPVFIVTGRLGSGKSLCMTGRMRDYLAEGRPVATNMDLFLDKMRSKPPIVPVYRLPDRPVASDFEALGQGSESRREDTFGGIFLDEAGTMFNARNWADKERQAIIDWLLHSRKRRWDIYIMVQALGALDKQIREMMGEYVVSCRRLDRMRIPFVGKALEALTLGHFKGMLPKVHCATVHYGQGINAVHSETWWYRGRELYDAYDTEQVIGASHDGLHCYTWPKAAEPVKAQAARLKPKRPEVAAMMEALQSPEDRWKAARALLAPAGGRGQLGGRLADS